MLRTFLYPTTARSYFVDHLPLFRQRRNSHFDLTVRDVLLRDNWLVVYRLHLSPTAGGVAQTRFLVAHHFSDSKFDKAAVRIDKMARAVGKWDPVAPQLVWRSASEKLLIYPFPLDTKISHLADAANPETVRERLSNQGGPLLNELASLPHCRVEAVRHVPMKRCQLRYTFCDAKDAGVSVYAKTFRRDRGEKLYHSMLDVASLFTEQGDSSLITPRPLAYLPKWQMVVQEEAAGRTLRELLQDGEATEEPMAAATRSVAVLHNSSLEVEEHHGPEDEMKAISAAHGRLARLGYASAGFEPSLSRIRDLASELPGAAPVPVHRDFYDRQLLIDGDRIALIDLDGLTGGHREIDIANFQVHLYLRSLQGQASSAQVRRWQHAFLTEYLRSGSEPPPNSIRLGFYLATTYFRLACKYRLRSEGALIGARLLGAAETALNECESEFSAAGNAISRVDSLALGLPETGPVPGAAVASPQRSNRPHRREVGCPRFFAGPLDGAPPRLEDTPGNLTGVFAE